MTPQIDPEMGAAHGHEALAHQESTWVAEKFPQTMNRNHQRLLRPVPVGFWPERIRESMHRDARAAHRDNRPQHVHRSALSFSRETHGNLIDDEPEVSEGVYLDRPRPCVGSVERRP